MEVSVDQFFFEPYRSLGHCNSGRAGLPALAYYLGTCLALPDSLCSTQDSIVLGENLRKRGLTVDCSEWLGRQNTQRNADNEINQ